MQVMMFILGAFVLVMFVLVLKVKMPRFIDISIPIVIKLASCNR
jgi:hypothetical protein